ncbi:MAG TPA: hypothetical protein VKU82_02210 [Planctomycetaceae bacterium]|nr:hypothetical protein [Planctomycetaceae bacterium]
MNELRKRSLAAMPGERRREIALAAGFLAAMLLALAGCSHNSGPGPGDARANSRQAESNADSDSDSLVAPIERDIEDADDGDVVMVSATSTTHAPGGALVAGDSLKSEGGSGPTKSARRRRALVLGTWEDDYRGKRHLTVHEDGTGTMVVEPDGIGKKLFAARLEFDLQWSLDGERITMKTMGGTPKQKVQLILKLYGSEADYTIVELTDERMLLLDADGKTRYDWRRPEADGK